MIWEPEDNQQLCFFKPMTQIRKYLILQFWGNFSPLRLLVLPPDLTLERPILSRHEDYHLCTWTSSSLLVFFVQLIQNVQSYTHCCSERRIVKLRHTRLVMIMAYIHSLM